MSVEFHEVTIIGGSQWWGAKLSGPLTCIVPLTTACCHCRPQIYYLHGKYTDNDVTTEFGRKNTLAVTAGRNPTKTGGVGECSERHMCSVNVAPRGAMGLL